MTGLGMSRMIGEGPLPRIPDSVGRIFGSRHALLSPLHKGLSRRRQRHHSPRPIDPRSERSQLLLYGAPATRCTVGSVIVILPGVVDLVAGWRVLAVREGVVGHGVGG